MRDMFGNEISEEEARFLLKRRRGTQPQGYAAKPGTGPKDETCGSCDHLVRNRLAKTYLKCSLMRRVWTGGRATDVKARSPACKFWKADHNG